MRGPLHVTAALGPLRVTGSVGWRGALAATTHATRGCDGCDTVRQSDTFKKAPQPENNKPTQFVKSKTCSKFRSQLSHCRMRQPLMRRMRQHVQRAVACRKQTASRQTTKGQGRLVRDPAPLARRQSARKPRRVTSCSQVGARGTSLRDTAPLRTTRLLVGVRPQRGRPATNSSSAISFSGRWRCSSVAATFFLGAANL